jgi:hypothetical protein
LHMRPGPKVIFPRNPYLSLFLLMSERNHTHRYYTHTVRTQHNGFGTTDSYRTTKRKDDLKRNSNT